MVEGEFCSGWRWEKKKKGRRLVSFFDTSFLVLLIYALGVLFLGGVGGREMGKKDPVLFFSHSFASRGKRKYIHLIPTHTMTHPHNRPHHLLPPQINQIRQIARMIIPTRRIPHQLFIHPITLSMPSDIRHPNAPDTPPTKPCLGGEFIPQRFIEFFVVADGVGGDDGDISWLRMGVVEGNVLVDGEVENVFFGVEGCLGEFAEVGGGDFVFDDAVVFHDGVGGRREEREEKKRKSVSEDWIGMGRSDMYQVVVEC